MFTDIEYERQAIEPNAPEIASGAEAADILGVSRQRLHQLRRHPGSAARIGVPGARQPCSSEPSLFADELFRARALTIRQA